METNDLQMFEEVKSKIHAIRGVQVMLDRDLADLYEVKNIRLREQFKRNIERFPKDFAFQLTKEEREKYEKIDRYCLRWACETIYKEKDNDKKACRRHPG